MHERNERAICRLVFLMLCALPTLGVVGWALALRTPWYHAAEVRALEEELSRLFGARVQIDQLRRPTPRVWELHGVRLENPETGRTVGAARRVLLTAESKAIYVILSQPELQADELGLAWEIFHRRLLCQPDLLRVPIQLRAADLSIRGSLQGITLTPLHLQIQQDATASAAQLQFAIAGGREGDAPPRLHVRRTRGDQPQTTWTLDCRGTPLPCGVLADYLPAMRCLGADATFAGLLRVQPIEGDYAVAIEQARFADVNMFELTAPLDDPVRGLADIDVAYLFRRHGNPVSSARGAIEMRGAQIHTRLLQSLSQLFRLQLDPRMTMRAGRVECDLVALRFHLDDRAVQLLGVGEGIDPSLPPQTGLVAGNSRLVVHAGTAVPRQPISLALQARGGLSPTLGLSTDWRERAFPEIDRAGRSSSSTAVPRVGRLRLQQPTR
jgi:hypothetical protein